MILIELSGKSKELRYDFNAICAIEEISNQSIIDLMQNARGFNTIRLLVWGGLRHNDNELTLDDVGDIIQEYIKSGKKLDELMVKVMEAMKDSGVLGDFNTQKDDADLGEQ